MDAAEKPREIVIHQSANRPNLLLGGDRELVLFAGLTAACLAFTLASIAGISIALVFWLGSVTVLSRMGKADPMLRHVYLRHLQYGSYYPAKSYLRSITAGTPRSWR
jgi:type IV secretory pathway TrbD component